MGLFDMMGSGGGLFTPEMKQAAALQSLLAMGSAIGDRSAPRLLTQQPQGPNPGIAAIQGYDNFLKNALGMSLLAEKLKGEESDRKIKEQQEGRRSRVLAPLFGQPDDTVTPSSGAAPPGTAAQPAAGAGGIFNDTPQNRMMLQLGLGVDPSKIYSAPTTKMMPLPGSGQMAEHEYRGGQWVPITSQPQAPSNFAYTPEGSLAPIAGGPDDPRVVGRRAAATAEGEAPWKGYPITQGGRLEFPFRNGGPSGSGTQTAASGGQPPAQGPYWKSRPGGGMSFGDPDELGKQTKDQVEGALFKAAGNLAEFGGIAGKFRPEYHQWFPQAQNAWTALKEKANVPGFKPTPQEQAQLQAYSTYLADTGRSMSKIRNELFGAALSGVEAKKAEQFLIEGNESPTQAKAKIDGFYDTTRKAVARLHYINKNGMTIDAVALDNMPKIIQQRGDAIAAQLKAQGVDGDGLRAAVKRQLSVEFGLVGE